MPWCVAVTSQLTHKGLFTVAIDARSGPLDMCREFKHAPDLVINAAETSAEETKEMIREARSKSGLSNDRPDGVDGKLPSSAV